MLIDLNSTNYQVLWFPFQGKKGRVTRGIILYFNSNIETHQLLDGSNTGGKCYVDGIISEQNSNLVRRNHFVIVLKFCRLNKFNMVLPWNQCYTFAISRYMQYNVKFPLPFVLWKSLSTALTKWFLYCVCI